MRTAGEIIMACLGARLRGWVQMTFEENSILTLKADVSPALFTGGANIFPL